MCNPLAVGELAGPEFKDRNRICVVSLCIRWTGKCILLTQGFEAWPGIESSR